MIPISFRSKRLVLVGLSVLLLGGGAIATYAVTTSRTESHGTWNMTDKGVAISGYDAVAYFTEGHPAKGSAAISYAWQDARWYFANRSHRDMFAADPEQYAPEYGGFCAAALTYGAVAKADPEVWAIVDGKLYLNYDHYAYELFHENLAQNIAKAKQKWAEKIEVEGPTRPHTAQAR